MIPVLFRVFGIPVYSFGLMMGIAFLVSNYFLVKEMRRRGISEEIAGTVTLIALIGGVAGSKLFSLLENWEAFLADPSGEIFSAAGLTFYGGFIVVALIIYFYTRSKGIRFLHVADSAAPALILGYGIGRIGCHLAGDGDYGIPSDLPWAMGYPNGTVSTLAEKNPLLVEKFREMYPDRAVPTDIMVHPAPVYETLAAIAIFSFLWYLRKRSMPRGMIFAAFLILAGLERLLIEFIRLNELYFGLSQAQWISLGMILLGIILIFRLRSAPAESFPEKPEPRRAGVPRAKVARRGA